MSVEAGVNWIDKLLSVTGRSGKARSDAESKAESAAETWAWETRPARVGPSATEFPRFQATAGDQLDRKRSNPFADARVRLSDAFTPSHPVTDRRMFAGRTEVLTRLIGALEGQRLHAIVYGERGIGKTSLLHVLAQSAREARYLVVYVSCGAASNFDETIRSVALEIPLLFHADYGPTAPESEKGATFADLLRPGPVSVRLASDLFANVIGTRVLIIMDEFDRSESIEFQRNVAELMKNLSDRAVRAQLVIAGVAGNLTEFVSHIPGIRRNILAMQIPPMTASEIRDLVRNGEEVSGLTFDVAALDFIVAVAHGLPYVASLLSHHAGLAAIDEGRMSVTSDDVSAAIAESLVELNGRISRRSQAQIAEGVRRGMHKVLATLAREALLSGGRFSVDDINALYRGSENAARCRSLIETLVQEGALIEAEEDEFGRHYRFLEESVPAYFWLLEAQERFLNLQKPAVADPSAEPPASAKL